MSRTVLITGASTGIGRATALQFAKKGWNVVATMRTPERESELNKLPNVLVTRLDVTDTATISAALDAAKARFGGVDVLVNNAGYGLMGIFEAMSDEQIRRQFDTNLFGLMSVVRGFLGHFREKKGGTVINVASMGGRLTFPLYSIYHGTKWAVEGFSESLHFELAPLGIGVKIVEPGAIRTDFYSRSADVAKLGAHLGVYSEFADTVTRNANAAGNKGTSPEAVAETIFRAATDGSSKLRYPVGSDAKALLLLRRFLPDRVYSAIVRSAMLRK